MLAMIVAYDKKRCIGNKGNEKLLWNIPEDLKRFKQITLGNVIIMGRNTFESLPKCLSHRKHWVLTRDENYIPTKQGDIKIFHSKEDILKEIERLGIRLAYVIGGESIYKEFLDDVSIIYATEVNTYSRGNAFFPKLDEKIFKKEPVKQDNKYKMWEDNRVPPTDKFNFVTYVRQDKKWKITTSANNQILNIIY